jgi:hypothetical protein
VVEVLVSGGFVLGLLWAANRAARVHSHPRPCPRGQGAGSCLGHATAAAFGPYVAGALGGAVLGLVLAATYVLAKHGIRTLLAGHARSASLKAGLRGSRAMLSSSGRSDRSAQGSLSGKSREATTAPTLESAVLSDEDRRVVRQKARAAVLVALRGMGGEAHRRALLARAAEIGNFTAAEFAAPVPEAAGEQYDRLVDHALSWSLTDLKRDGLVENPELGMWRLTAAGRPPVDRLANPEPASAARVAELRAMDYRDYLRTQEWRRTRAAALVLAKHACAFDVTHTRGLDVHHRTYDRLGEELVDDLLVLCRDCHALHHKHHGRPRRRDR